MYCPECGYHQSKSHRFCARCGAPLPTDGQGTSEITGPFSAPDPAGEATSWQGPSIGGPTLVVRAGGPAGTVFALAAPEVSVGRDPEADLFLDDVTVSRNHATIAIDDRGVVLRDLQSLNGTYVNRRRIVADEPLQHGDEIQIGKFRLVFLTG